MVETLFSSAIQCLSRLAAIRSYLDLQNTAIEACAELRRRCRVSFEVSFLGFNQVVCKALTFVFDSDVTLTNGLLPVIDLLNELIDKDLQKDLVILPAAQYGASIKIVAGESLSKPHNRCTFLHLMRLRL